MRDPLPVKLTRRAEREIEKADLWWRDNREAAPEALREELENAFRLIATQPHIGAKATNAKLGGVRRIHLSRVHYHLYYRVRPDQTALEVLALTRPGSVFLVLYRPLERRHERRRESWVFANIRSPGTLANLRRNANVEVNVVDPFVRKGYRFKGVASILESGPLYDKAIAFYKSGA